MIVKDNSLASNKNYDDNSWRKVTLPWAWNEDDAFRKDIVTCPLALPGTGKNFKVPATAKGQKVFIEFEGV